jgi:hypothetical protein
MNPGLYVPGVGTIRLPLGDENLGLQGIREPVTGPKTLLQSCDNGWNKYELQNLPWETYRNAICERVLKTMEIRSGICKPNLLLCSKESWSVFA